jgi:hypothetical protein
MQIALVIILAGLIAGCSRTEPAVAPRNLAAQTSSPADSPLPKVPDPNAAVPDAPPPPELATDASVAETPASIDESVEKPATDPPSSTPPAPLAVSAGADPAEADTADGKEDEDTDETASQGIQPLTDEEQEKLLASRLDGGMSFTFRQFANQFLVTSRFQLSQGVGLMTLSKEISNLPLQSPFPSTYKPTLREFLDSIALQTFSEWEYDPSSKFFQSKVKHTSPVTGLAMFEFKPAKREKPYEVTLAEGWKAVDKGNWTMHVPPVFPVGMDIFESGTYSADDQTAEDELLERIPTDLSLERAKSLGATAVAEDLSPRKVGPFDALFFDKTFTSPQGQQIRWRQWVFMDGNKCYLVVSAIFPQFEDKIFPDVEKMVASFQIKETSQDSTP